MFRQLQQLRLLVKKIAIAHDQLVVASFEFPGAHIPQASGGGIIFRQHRIELTAERHSFLDLTEQLVALLVQQLLVKAGGLHHQAQSPAL